MGKYEYKAAGFNCGICKAQGKATTNQMRPMWNHPKYNRETGEFVSFRDEDVTVTVPITSRAMLVRHKQYEHREEFKEAEQKARVARQFRANRFH